MSVISSADFVLLVEGLSAVYFTRFSGLSLTIERPTYSDGLSNRLRTGATGQEKVEECELEIPFDPDQSSTIIEFFESKRNGDPFACSIQAVRRGKNLERRSSKVLRLSGCRLSKLSYPGEVDLAGGATNVAKLMVSFSVDDFSYAGTASKDPTTASSLNV